MDIGLDVGSAAAKLVYFEKKRLKFNVVESVKWPQLIKGLKGDIYSTGYFRNIVPHKKSVTEITSAMFGARHFMPGVEVVVDIGGQDVKVTDLRSNRFQLNNKCSAGTGAFLEFVAKYFDIPLRKLGDYHFKAKRVADINSTCGVFALSEMISQLVNGYSMEEVVAGMHYAFARRIAELVPESEHIMVIGGVAKNKGLVKAFSEILDRKLFVPREPQIVNAVGVLKYSTS